jgi:cobalt-zinc-cadmium efflux system protein
MSLSDAHGHPHGHASTTARGERALMSAFVLVCVMLVVEAAGGWWSGSLALLADAGHMLVDAGALLMAWLASVFAMHPADARRTFGYARMEVLAGFVNALVQVLLVAWIAYEAARRLLALDLVHIRSGVMLVVAAAGLLVNALVLRMLHSHDRNDLNIAGAALHAFGDLLGSVATVVAALLVRYLAWEWADPALSLLVSLLILGGAWQLLRRSAHILLEGVPEGLRMDEIRAVLVNADPSIAEIHHLHVWQLASGSRMATLHARLHNNADPQHSLHAIKRIMLERFGIGHATVQIERGECPDGDATCAEAAHEP